MLTVARTSEVRLATFGEIEGEVWMLTPGRTKTGREHRVPLTPEALKVIELARERSPNEYLFPALKAQPISDMAMSSFMKREGYEARPHGFRATFRTWVEEQTDTPFEVKEAALGVTIYFAISRRESANSGWDCNSSTICSTASSAGSMVALRGVFTVLVIVTCLFKEGMVALMETLALSGSFR